MEITVCNPQKGWLETITVEFTDDNTTWFDNCCNPRGICMITDFEGDLLISEFGYTHPFRIYDTSRADIGYSQNKARKLMRMHE